jgi:hypothetical protein
MQLTHHARMRANQRGFSAVLLDLVADHGTWLGDRQVLDRRALAACLAQMDDLRRRLVRLLDKSGGTLVLAENGAAITVFSPRTYRRTPRRLRDQECD